MDDKSDIPIIGKKKEMVDAVDLLRRSIPDIIANAIIIAEIRKASYDAHVAQGFTKDQALELCKTMSL